MTLAGVNLWGRRIGAVSVSDPHETAVFQYDPGFAERSTVDVSPIEMPRRVEPYAFPGLARETFLGLPGLLADSLPDRFGNALIDAWLASSGRSPDDFDAVERLCYIGTRGMGALEFVPETGPETTPAKAIAVDALVELASKVLTHRANLEGYLSGDGRASAVRDILAVGTSAGGARAKAIVAWSPSTQEVRSGQVDQGPGFEHWLLKFDGVTGNKDKELEDPRGYGAIEYAYSKMATAAGIDMTDCRLLEESGRRHFMTRRFDRPDRRKLHMQSLGALAHLDFNQAGAHSYEQALLVIRRLGLPMEAIEQQFRRMAFNVVARNQDDHVKNISFLMDQDGQWSLSPAYDVTYAFQPGGRWTSRHQMSMSGKRDDFTIDDFRQCAEVASMKRGRAESIVGEVHDAVVRWPSFAEAAGVADLDIERIARAQRLRLDRGSRLRVQRPRLDSNQGLAD